MKPYDGVLIANLHIRIIIIITDSSLKSLCVYTYDIM